MDNPLSVRGQQTSREYSKTVATEDRVEVVYLFNRTFDLESTVGYLAELSIVQLPQWVDGCQ